MTSFNITGVGLEHSTVENVHLSPEPLTFPDHSYLTKADDEGLAERPQSWWCFRTRHRRNVCRVVLAGGLSAAGGWLASFAPTHAGIINGGILGGVGNAASTWLAWEKKNQLVLEKRIINDFRTLAQRIHLIDTHLSHLVAHVDKIFPLFENAVQTIKPTIQLPPAQSKHRMRDNIKNVLIAGGLSTAGGLVAGLITSDNEAIVNTAILAGGVLGGVGNAVSTWLAYEQIDDKLIKTRGMEDLPKLIQIVEQKEEELINLIKEVSTISIYTPPILQSIERPPFLANSEEEILASNACLTATRGRRNAIYINTAGWLSAGGGWLASYVPTVPGIVLGSTLSGFANSVSTWLAWENINDEEVERTVKKDFPKVEAKINEIALKIIGLTKRLKETEESQQLGLIPIEEQKEDEPAVDVDDELGPIPIELNMV
jgi:hypothetical protein